MQMRDEREPHIQWNGIDETGHFRGTFRDGGRLLSISIAVPGRGNPPHSGPLHNVLICGQKMGSMPNLKSAQALAELHLLTRRSLQIDKSVLAGLGLLQPRVVRGR